MKFMHYSLLACLLTFSLNAADEPSYIFEAKGEFAKELKSLVEKYSKDENISINVYEKAPETDGGGKFLNIGVDTKRRYSVEKGRELYAKKDYGRYGTKDGKMPLCFLSTSHTTGGNSGSPAIDAHGNLIGLNFDRVWEGTMSDIHYDPKICRNIMVDMRYVLFVIDKYAGAGYLVDEMKLVK